MRVTKEGLLTEEEGRELGGSFEFTLEEVVFFSHMLSVQIAKMNLKKAKAKRKVKDAM